MSVAKVSETRAVRPMDDTVGFLTQISDSSKAETTLCMHCLPRLSI
jgi:hypothetical protein